MKTLLISKKEKRICLREIGSGTLDLVRKEKFKARNKGIVFENEALLCAGLSGGLISVALVDDVPSGLFYYTEESMDNVTDNALWAIKVFEIKSKMTLWVDALDSEEGKRYVHKLLGLLEPIVFGKERDKE